MSIIQYRTNIINKLKASFPQLRDVLPHPGKFTLEDFERLCLRAPAAYVAIIGAPGKEKLGTGQVLFDVNVGVFIATKGRMQENADVSGWNVAETIAALAMWNYFNSPVFPAQNVEIDNLWTSELDKNQVCIMGVAWDTQVMIGADLSAQEQAVKAGDGFVFTDPNDVKVNGTVFGTPDV
jgi:phage gp37-like protein